MEPSACECHGGACDRPRGRRAGRTGAFRRAWTLADRPVSLDVHYGVAVTASRTAVRAIDLAANRSTVLTRRASPLLVGIEASGVVYGYNANGRGFLRTLSIHDLERRLKPR